MPRMNGMPYHRAVRRFIEEITERHGYAALVELLLRHKPGDMWLVGGSVYRHLIRHVWGNRHGWSDFDIITSRRITDWALPDGWHIDANKYGQPKLKFNGSNLRADVVCLEDWDSIKMAGAPPKISSYLELTPLNIQSIAYNIRDREVVGTKGRDAIENGVVAVNNLENALYAAKMSGKTVEELVREKAESLGFRAVILDDHVCHKH